MEPNSPKKIQFAVPLFQSQIDPEAAEQEDGPIPHSSATANGTKVVHQINSEEEELYTIQDYILIRKRRPTPASLVIMNEHLAPEKNEKRTSISQAESQSASSKQRKQSVFTAPALKGIKHLKSQSDSVLPEEEEEAGETEEEWGH